MESQVEACLDWDAAATSTSGIDYYFDHARELGCSRFCTLSAATREKDSRFCSTWMGFCSIQEQFCSTYDWDFDGKWKKFAPSKKNAKTQKKKVQKKQEKKATDAAAQETKAKAKAAKLKKLAAQKGVAKQSAAELYVAEKMLPFFATGSEYQKRYSVPAAVRQKAVAKIVETQAKVAAGFRKPKSSSMKNDPILSGGRRYPTSVQNIPVRTSYQSAFGSVGPRV